MSADFSVRVTGFPAVPLITVQGELDLATAGRLDDALRTAGEDGTLITVDLSGVDYLDSAAVRVLFRHAARVKLTLMLPANGTVAPVVDVCGLSRAATVRISSPLSCPVPDPAGPQDDGEGSAAVMGLSKSRSEQLCQGQAG